MVVLCRETEINNFLQSPKKMVENIASRTRIELIIILKPVNRITEIKNTGTSISS
jgi:hypothetical protein